MGNGKLPEIQSDESLAPIKATAWKCRKQIYASLIMFLGVCNLGSIYGWSTIAVTLMKEEDKIQFDEATMTSIYIVGALLSGPVAAYTMLKLGRRLAMLGHAIVLSIGWSLIPLGGYMTNNNAAVWTMYIGRVITGFAGAGCLTIAHVYVGEICLEDIRPLIGSLMALFLITGNLLPSLFGLFLGWRELSWICWLFPMSLTILLIWAPESPIYLLMNGKPERAKKECKWLTTGFTKAEQERIFKRFQTGVELLAEDKLKAKTLRLTSRVVLFPLLISIVLMFISRACGINIILLYSVEILKASGSPIAPKLGTVLIALCFVVFVVVASILVSRLPRKTLLLISTLTNGVVLTALGVFFQSNVEGVEPSAVKLGWVPFFLDLIFIATFGLGMGSVVWVVVTDINHPEWQEIGSSVTTTTYWLTNLLTTMTYPAFRRATSYHVAFWVYAAVCFAGSIFVFFCLFETKGKSHDEIIEHFQGENKEDGAVPSADSSEFIGKKSPTPAAAGKVRNNQRCRCQFNIVPVPVHSDWSQEILEDYLED